MKDSELEFDRTKHILYPKKFEAAVRRWLADRYGDAADGIWEQVQKNYVSNLADTPDVGGAKNEHAMAIYGGLLIFSLYPALPDQPPISELQELTQTMFMDMFVKLGKIFDLNRPSNMRLIDYVFRKTGGDDRKQSEKYPDTFIMENEPYDKENRVSRYHFTQCPNAEFAKKHNLLHVLPLLCNCDYFGIAQIHGKLIRRGTCGFADICDYTIVGDKSDLAAKYNTVTNDGGYLVSVEAGKEKDE